MRVLFLVLYDEQKAESRRSAYQYLPYFDSLGIDYKVIPIVTKDFPGNRLFYYPKAALSILLKVFKVAHIASRYDVVVINDVLLPFHLERLILASNKNIVYEMGDALYAGYDTSIISADPARMLLKRLSGVWLARMLRVSRHVLVENEQNRQFASNFCNRVSVITGPLDTTKYVPRTTEKSRSSKIVLGWIGSFSTTPYLEPLTGVFDELCNRYPNLRVKLVGASELKTKNLRSVDIRKWTLQSEIKDLQDFDIGIMPLPDNQWTRGKGGYKLLQYLCCGVPCVASPVGINTSIIQEGVNGFLARDRKEWIEKLSLLIESLYLRQQMGRNARYSAEEKYSIKANLPKLLTILGGSDNGC